MKLPWKYHRCDSLGNIHRHELNIYETSMEFDVELKIIRCDTQMESVTAYNSTLHIAFRFISNL